MNCIFLENTCSVADFIVPDFKYIWVFDIFDNLRKISENYMVNIWNYSIVFPNMLRAYKQITLLSSKISSQVS